MRVPSEAGAGPVKITLSMPNIGYRKVAPSTLDAFLVGDEADLPYLAEAMKRGGSAARDEILEAVREFTSHVPGAEQFLLNAASAGDAAAQAIP